VPSAALVHDHFTGPTGMGLVVGTHARWLLDAGWEVTLVGDNVPPDLVQRARVVRAPRPRRLPSMPEHLEWCRRAARALRPLQADIVHVHAPLLAGRADLLTAHFISRPARSRGIRDAQGGLEGVLRRAQSWASDALDHAGYRRAQGRTHISFVSEFLREEYTAHYGPPRGGWILPPPAPPWDPAPAAVRAAAKARYGVAGDELVVGFVGGIDPRKGAEAVRALVGAPGLTLLFAGPGSEQVLLDGRPGLGFVDIEAFLPACDVLVAPSAFDSAPVAILQALSRGVPVVTSKTLGWAPAVERHGAGAVWSPGEDLAAAARRGAAAAPDNCRALVEELSDDRQRQRLIEVYTAVLAGTARP
jgi:glycosyltransferase involved in cell wall biosynthesis